MQRLLTLVFVLCLAIPAGISISGCTRNPGANYCNGLGYGLKLSDPASIDLEPRTTGISLVFGQTQQLTSPTAKNCKGTSAGVAGYSYGTSNNQVVDVSPTGNLCAGVWNRRSGGGIPDFTTCLIPSPLPTTGGLPFVQASVTATASSITSNQVQVFVHAQTTGVSLLLEQPNNPANIINGCLSQTQTAQLDAKAFYNNNGTQSLLCEPVPNTDNVPSCSTAVGSLSYSSQNPNIATIDQNGVITALQPGTTYITASIAGSSSPSGYFSTCPPANISVTLNGKTSGSVTRGVTQNLVTTITDTKGATIQGLTLDYQSTNPLDISAGANGQITANFAGQTTIYAVCQPGTCNPSPIDKVGVNQTGTGITSNSVTITTPGLASDYVWFANPSSRYFVPVELISGTVGSTVRMPYFPNSMVMDKAGTSLYFGSSTELMIYNTASNTLTKEDPNVPGIVLAAAPNNQNILINDPIRKVLYLYTPGSFTFSQQSGVATSAEWTPDGKTVFVVGVDLFGKPTLFVNNVNTGWTTYPLTVPSSNVAVMVPGVGAFLSGNPTAIHGWCPKLQSTATKSLITQAYPEIATVGVETETLAATNDGAHVLGIGLNGGTTPTLTDFNISLSGTLDSGACPHTTDSATDVSTSTNSTVSPVTSFVQKPLPIQATSITGVVPAIGADLAFITYLPSGAGSPSLPYYQPNAGTVGQITLSGSATAPVAGAFSLDDTLFFVSTAGDNLVHYVDVKSLTEKQTIKPGLVDANGSAVPATLIAVKPRSTT